MIFLNHHHLLPVSEKEDSDSSQQKSEKQSSFGGFSFWKPSSTRGDDAIMDSEQCLELAKQLKRTESTVHGNFHTTAKTNGKRTSEQVSIKRSFCGQL